MSRIFSLFILTLLALPTTVYSSDSENGYFIERQKLDCMYKQIDDLLDEPDDNLVMVILTNQCDHSSGTENDVVSRSLPEISMPPSNTPSDSSKTILGPDDILMLTHVQLECFKQNYENLLADEHNPLEEFKNTCKIDEDH